MSSYFDKPPQSLIERKKEQWAREREELARLNNLWNRDGSSQSRGKGSLRSRNVAKLPHTGEYHRRELSSSGRKQSLPPLAKNRNSISSDKIDREMGGETSGYGSDSQTTPEYYQNANWAQGYESSGSSREDRLKWIDKNVITAKYWEPKEEELKGVNDTPGWLKRGLETNAQLEVANSSPAESPEQDLDKDRPYTGSSSSIAKTYIRGQNIHLEPEEIAERERKRQAALEHQQAIRKQLEEREKKRLEEKEQRIREEREEELRIQRDKEIERKRRENEEKLQQEKAEREQKRKEAIQQAMEIAREEAMREKMKQKLHKQSNVTNNANFDNNNSEKEKLNNKMPQSPRDDITVINNISISHENDWKEQKNSNNFNEKSNNNDTSHSHKTNITVTEKNNNLSYRNQDDNVLQMSSLTSCDSLSLVLQTPLETLQNMQFAVLMPASGSGAGTTLPIAVPITLPIENGTISSNRTENRILTPTPYKLKKLVDSSTQTDLQEFKFDSAKEKQLKDKLNSLELNYDSRGRKERRSRESVDERPKWGANRPPTRYLKQSEKDPLYQRRKLRQKIRQATDKRSYSPHSSDESQTGSPRSYRKNSNRNSSSTRALWRKSDRLFGENMRLYQTEVIPLESDKDHIYYKMKASNDCCCRCSCSILYKDRIKTVDILKIEHNSSREPDNELDNRSRLPDYNVNGVLSDGSEIMQKLNHLHNGLQTKQEQWRNTPTTPCLSTPRRNSENLL